MRTQSHITDCLRDNDPHSKIALDRLLQHTRLHDGVAWYPSSGEDYRDVLECGTERNEEHGFEGRPGLYVHTDLNGQYAQIHEAGSVVWEDERTTVTCASSQRVSIDASHRAEAMLDKRMQRPYDEIACVLNEIQVESNKYGTVRAWVLSICIDNHVFLNDFLVPMQLQLSHVIKVREAPHMSILHGLDRQKSIAHGFVYLGILGVQWILADDLVISSNVREGQVTEPRHFCNEYDIQSTGDRFRWSGLAVTPYSVSGDSASRGHQNPHKGDHLILLPNIEASANWLCT